MTITTRLTVWADTPRSSRPPESTRLSRASASRGFHRSTTTPGDPAADRTSSIFLIEAENLVLAHLGDLGVPLTDEQRKALSHVDVLMAPVGGYYTIDAKQAAALARSLPAVRVVLPMHYRTELIADWPIAPVDEFLRTMDNVRHIGSSSVVLDRAALPEALEVWVLDHA